MATKTPSSSNHDNEHIPESKWTQEYVNGLKSKYKDALLWIPLALTISLTFIFISNYYRPPNLSSLEMSARYALWCSIVLVLPQLYFLWHFFSFRFFCPRQGCEYRIRVNSPWKCPFCLEKTDKLSVFGFTIFTQCGHFDCRRSPPAVKCPECGYIIPLIFHKGTQKFARFLDATDKPAPPPRPVPPPREEPPFP